MPKWSPPPARLSRFASGGVCLPFYLHQGQGPQRLRPQTLRSPCSWRLSTHGRLPLLCRVLRVFWDITVGMYAAGRLDVTFFQTDTPWLTRATTYMELVEPIEIANYYRCGNWKKWSVGKRHYLEDNIRPSRFPFFEAQFAQFYPEGRLEP